ncbi:serine/threonine-protein phosphatase 4 regulatory subunit 4 [Diplonema papillatum]|nr:serine/threonine-protein phosphatase 4 regulatory subunit 4 [Diplonema papillatum]
MPRSPRSDDPFYAHELPNLDGLNAVNANCKHEASVYKYIEEQGMNSCAKVVYILQKGSDGQRMTVLEHLHVSLSDCTDDEVSTVTHELNECMWQLVTPLQVAGADAVKKCVGVVSPARAVEFIELIETMLQLKEDKVMEAWDEVYLEVLKHAPEPFLKGKMVEIVLKKGELSELATSRALCCRMIGAFCDRTRDADAVTRFLDKASALCQDIDWSVRSAMCCQLNALARCVVAVDPAASDLIVKELTELLDDEEGEVLKTAFGTLLDLTECLGPAFKKKYAYPLIRKYLTNPPPAIQPVLTASFGRCLCAVQNEVVAAGSDDAMLFVRYFTQCAAVQDPAVRQSCAYNLPAVCASLPTQCYANHLHPILKALSEDACCDTRISIAAGLHELAKLMGSRSFSLFKGVFMTLLQDKDPAVQDKLIQNMSTLLNMFSEQAPTPDEKERYFSQLVPPLLQWWENSAVKSTWRMENIHRHLEDFPDYFTQAQLHTTFIPLLLKQLSTGPRALVPRSSRMLMLFCRRLSSAPQEDTVFSKLVSDFAKSPSYWNRLAFIEVCHSALEFYSKKSFRDRLLPSALELANDPVSAVRRRLCMLLSSIKRVLLPPAGVDHLTSLIQVVSTLRLDSNTEVLEAIQPASEEIDRIDKRLRSAQIEVDASDAAKEAEELALRDAALEQDKLERRQKIRDMLQNDRLEKEKNFQEGRRNGKRNSSDSTTRLPPAPSGSVVRQPVGGIAVSQRLTGRTSSEKKRNSHAPRTPSAKR